MHDQDQFLNVIDRDEAERRFREALTLQPLGSEVVAVRESLGRVLSERVIASVDVPAFDRSNFDGYAVQAADTFGVSERSPGRILLLPQTLEAGAAADFRIERGQAATIATGGMLPGGADAVLMIEHADELDGNIIVRRAVTPGTGISFAGTDIACGETVLPAGTPLTSRETGVLAALGETHVAVWKRPRVTVISTGNEILSPGEPPRAAAVYDSNSQVLMDAVRELGGEPVFGGIIRDDTELLRQALQKAIAESDLVLMSGGTSKGRGDLCYRVVSELRDPGIVVHGVALKPGKPICMAVTAGKAVVVLPGFPTSAIFTFHEFIGPVLRLLAGRQPETQEVLTATLAVQANSEAGRTEYLLVGLVQTERGLSAWPMGKGSGSVTTFSRADGFLTIPRHTEIVNAGQQVQVRLLGRGLELADLVVMGSHCVGLDFLLAELQRRGFRSRMLTVGSSAGLAAVTRGEADLSGIHLLDPVSGTYNRSFLNPAVTLVRGYGRSQGVVFRPDDRRFAGYTLDELRERLTTDTSLMMVNRNQGSGTRILIDQLLQGFRPAGYVVQPSNHSAVAAAIRQHRADWGVTIQAVAAASGLGFVPLQHEEYDFVVSNSRIKRPAVQAFLSLLTEETIRMKLGDLGFIPGKTS